MMNAIDFFIFIVTLIMLTIIYMRKAAQERRQRTHSEEEPEIKPKKMRQKKTPILIKENPPPLKKESSDKDLDIMKKEQTIAYGVRKAKTSRADILIKSLKSPQEMMIIHELFMPPKGFRQPFQ